MHFVDRGDAPPELIGIEREERVKWDAYYQGKRKSEPKGRWTEPEIRDILVAAFQENCGYCGRHETVETRGEVDHYIPKQQDELAKSLTLTYLWTNFIWSCHACNTIKQDFYDPLAPILNPCNREDMSALVPDEMGGYQLRKAFRKDPAWVKRFDNTLDRTLINQKSIKHDRKVLRDRIKSILGTLEANAILADMDSECREAYARDLKTLKDLTQNHFKLFSKWLLEEMKAPVSAADLGIR